MAPLVGDPPGAGSVALVVIAAFVLGAVVGPTVPGLVEHPRCESPPAETSFEGVYKLSEFGPLGEGYVYVAETTFSVWVYDFFGNSTDGTWTVYNPLSHYGGPGLDHTIQHAYGVDVRTYFLHTQNETLSVYRKSPTSIGKQGGRVVQRGTRVATC